MSMIVGMHLGDYVIIAADRREVYINDGKIESVISDDIQKIIDWNSGYITGSGYVPLLSVLKESLSKTRITNTDQIVALTEQLANCLPHGMSYWKNQTNWMFTYPTADAKGPLVRLAQSSSAKPSELRLMHEMHATIWAKLPHLSERITHLTNSLLPSSKFPSLADNIEYHLNLLPELFEYGASLDQTVCSQFTYCIHCRDGNKILS